DTATIVAEDPEGRILLTREYSHPPREMTIEFPGGAIEENEEPLAGAQRELREETGFAARSLRFLGTYLVNNRRSTRRMHVFHAQELYVAPLEQDPEEAGIEVVWASKERLREMIRSGEAKISSLLSTWAIFEAHMRP